jgi:hypothetical protein
MKDDHSVISWYLKKSLTVAVLFSFLTKSYSQNDTGVSTSALSLSQTYRQDDYDTSHDPSHALNKRVQKNRALVVGGASLVVYGVSFMALSDAWFKGYPHSSFHFFNDSGEWLQTDKAGHSWTAYNIARISAGAWRWSGLSNPKAALIGGGSALLYMVAIEWMDAHSEKWGWSWGDIGADVFGTTLFISQELAWQEQRIQYKFSFHHQTYGEIELNERAEGLFGKSGFNRTLQDYNAQTYWFSANLRSFFRQSNLPGWLNISVGYGSDGMFGEFENKWINKSGVSVDRTNIERVRQFYFAPDVDFTKIKTNKKWLRTIFFCLNAFKCPAPALMFNSKGAVKFYALYF